LRSRVFDEAHNRNGTRQWGYHRAYVAVAAVIITPMGLDIPSLGLGDSGSVRAAGLHASDIYNSFYADLDPKKYLFKPGPIEPLLVEIGLIFERMLELGLQKRLLDKLGSSEEVARPGEFTFQDTYRGKAVTIHFNPDLFIANGCLRVAEIKSTWKWSGVSHAEILAATADIRAGRFGTAIVLKIANLISDPKFDKYLTQLKFYLYMLRERFGRLYIFFVVANGRPPFPSQLLGWDLEFSDEELKRCYTMLLNHALAKGMLG
jgi:hypothetical protein